MFGFWSIAQMSLFFTLIGLFNAFIMWPIALLLYFLGAELIVCKCIADCSISNRRMRAKNSQVQVTNKSRFAMNNHLTKPGRYIPWVHLTAAGALHLSANILAYFGPICSYDIFLTLGLLMAVFLSSGECR